VVQTVAEPGIFNAMDTATETERKYDVPEGFAVPALAGAGGIAAVDEAETHELDATYFDTDDLRLARHRRTLRRRTGGSDAGWHLKTPGDGSSRTEHRLPLGDDADTVPDELLAQVRAIVRERPLRPVARLRTRRREAPLRDDTGRTLALLAQDEVIAETDGVEQRWSEVEVELVDGAAAVLKAVEKRLLKAGATVAAGPSKLARALGDRLTASRPATTKNAVAGYVREQRDTIVAFDQAVRHGDAEAIHKMRVATRRLRSTLKTFRDLWSPGQVVLLRAELKWLGERLGGVRDPQVQTQRFADAVDAADPDLAPVGVRLHAHLGEQLDRGRTALGTALDDTRYLRLLDELDQLADTAPAASGGLRRKARKALRKADRLLDAADDDEHLHEARKEYKRARYAVEVFAPAVGKPAKRLVAALTELQDALGAHQDTVVARDLLRDLAGQAHQAGENGFGYGVLHARQQAVGEQALGDVPLARHRAGRRKLRNWM
jgi:CHAD domain-containing protein